MIKETSAGVLIFYLENNKPIFLMLKYLNYWGFVKGLIEKGEGEIATVRREAKEEANISQIQILEGFKQLIKYSFRFKGEIISKKVTFFLGKVEKEEAGNVRISFEHQGFKWLSFDDALRIMKHKNERDLLTKANELLKDYLKQRRL